MTVSKVCRVNTLLLVSVWQPIRKANEMSLLVVVSCVGVENNLRIGGRGEPPAKSGPKNP